MRSSPSAPPLTPTSPSGLVATRYSKTRINLAWTDNSSDETGFIIERSTDQTNWTLVTTTSANVTTFSNIGLAKATTFYYRVRATNGSGDSGNSNMASMTTTVICNGSDPILPGGSCTSGYSIYINGVPDPNSYGTACEVDCSG